MQPLSVDERLQTQFFHWDTAPEAELPELLISLRSHGTPLTLFREYQQQSFTAQVTRLMGKSIQLELQNTPPRCETYLFGGKVLCVGYGKDYAVAFLTQTSPEEGNVLQLTYPSRILIRRGRRHERFRLAVAVSAEWNKNVEEWIFGDVMDFSLGEDGGGMHLVTYDDGTRPFQPGELGRVILRKADGEPWEGMAELCRVDRMAVDERQDYGELEGTSGFSMLGFAFLLKNPEQTSALEHFLDGVLERE